MFGLNKNMVEKLSNAESEYESNNNEAIVESNRLVVL
jgi:hypothetical protein